jgi:GDP-L-fucose synthase
MKIYVAGHRGLVGSAIVRRIEEDGRHSWIGRSRDELDLFQREEVFNYVSQERPDAVVIAAARVGGIVANNDHPVEFLTENLQIEMSLLDACHSAGIERVLFLGSSCIYPRLSPQPIREEYLLTGPLEPTNESYAISKIAGIKLVEGYRKQYGRKWISAMPTNLYGPGDNFDLETSHVLPALIRKFYEAKKTEASQVTLWGTGSPMREFLHVDDLARACLYLLETYDDDVCINVGSGTDVSIKELAQLVADTAGFVGNIVWDESKPDGMPRKLLDISRILETGWKPTISLNEGVSSVYDWYSQRAED